MAPRKSKDDSEKTVLKRGESYEHYVKAVPVLENFEEVYKLKYHLVKSYDELMDFYHNQFKPDSFFAWDTETTSLNCEQGKKTGDLVEGRIVGYSFTQNGCDGYYVPLTHPDISIGYKGLKVLYAMICRSKLHLLYNARFDMRFLEAMTPDKYDYTPEPDEKIYKFDLSKTKYFDVQCSVWLADTNIPMPSLKKSEKHFLGWNPPTFSDTVGSETNFGYLPAEQGYRYACIDALGTYHLFFKTECYYAESGAAGKLDNELLYPLMKLENTPVYIDHEYLASMKGDIHRHLQELKNYLYEKVGGNEYNISSGRELIGVFQQLGIDTGARTATGQMKTDIKTIESYQITHGNNEYLAKLVEYKKLFKFDNSYLETLLKISSPDEVKKHPVRFNYFTCRVPTGRLACGTDGKNKFFSPVNFQSLPKPHSHNYHTHLATEEQIANKEDICGYIFNDDPEGSLGLVEGQDPHLNVRRAIRPPTKDSVIISVDMKAEELRLAANVFNEPTWINAFNTGQDVHKMTAIKIFGEENYCKEARKKAKTANFGILYGSSAWGFHNQFPDMTLEECEDFIDKFKSALPSIEASQMGSVRFGRKNGFVKTYFGRPRRVKYYFSSPSRSMQGFGKRTCMNTVVQGCAGDALKLMIVRLWNDLFTKYYDKGVRWIGTIHDEINYLVPRNLLDEVIPIIMECQTIKLPDWQVPLLPDLSIGDSFGSLIPFEYDFNTHKYKPAIESIKEKDLHPGDSAISNYVPEIEDDYDYMK